MTHTLIDLPYPKNALEPYMSEETLDYHYSIHHQTYVDKLNGLIEGTEFEDMYLEEIIKNSEGGIFNNAAQIWNHDLFWTSFSEKPQSEPQGKMQDMIEKSFGSVDKMKERFKNESLGRFGSGWTWLVQKGDNLEIYSTPNGENPLTHSGNTLLGCDVWEHAYYIDTRNDRGKYIENFWKIVDWSLVEKRLSS